MTTTPQTTETLEQRFVNLLARWRAETAPLSSSTLITGHPAYEEIIALGTAALPLLFRELDESKDGHLAKALAALTGARLVSQEDRGKIRKVAEAWLHWGRDNGYTW
jgi:hypothetical protein